MSDEPRSAMAAGILICGNHPEIAEDLAAKLRSLGHEVVGVVFNHDDAMRAAEELRPDLVLMDIQPPGKGDGMEAGERIGASGHIPVVYLRAYAEEDISEGKPDTCGRPVKPVDLPELRSAVEIALYKHEANKRVRESEERLRSILGSLHDFVFVMNEEGIFTDYHEPPDLRKLYVPPEAFIGRHYKDVLPQDVSGLLEGAIIAAERTDLCQQFDYPMVIAGRQEWFSANVSARRTVSGIFDGVTIVSRDITERKKMEESLKESEQRYRTLFEKAGDAILIIELEGDSAGQIVAANPVAAQIHGYETDELPTMNVADLDTPESAKKIPERIERILGGEWLRERTEHRKKDGAVFPIEISACLVHLGGRKYSLAIERDITVLKKAEDALRESETKYRTLVEQIPAVVYVAALDQASTTLYVSPRIEALLGFSQADYAADPDIWRKRLHPDDRRRVLDELAKSHESAEPFASEYRMKAKDGGIIWFRDEARAIYDENGHALCLQGVMFDITNRKKTEEDLLESEERFRRISSSISDIAYSCRDSDDGAYSIEWITGAVEQITGYSADEIKALKSWRGLVIDEDLPFFDNYVTGLVPGQKGDCELRLRTRTGGIVWVGSFTECVLDAVSPERIRLFGGLMDITERKKAEEEILKQKEFLDTVIESLNHPFFVINANNFTIEKTNSAAESYGIHANSTCHAAPHHNAAPCRGNDYACPLEEVKKTGRSVTVEHVHQDSRGNARNVEIHCFPISDGDGHVRRVIEYRLDITDRKKAQESLLQTEKFRAVIDLTSGVAHNFNNLLQIIMGNASLGLMKLQSGNLTDLKKKLEQIMESSKFGAQTVRRISRYALGREPGRTADSTVFDLSEIVEQAVQISRPWWNNEPEKRGITISLDTRLKRGCTIRGDKNDLFEVVVNLIKNAVEALPEGGNIEMETRADRGKVELCVRDSGIGIPKENLNRLFTPFFTTSVEAGRGLGLATSRRIVDAHGGAIHVESIEGKGAAFMISFPLAPKEAARREVLPSKSTQKALRILAVDEMEATVKLLKAGMEIFGHNVLTALSGEEALRVFRQNPIDLVICDLGMPGMNGWRVGSAVKAICHEKGKAKTPFIILTGWDDQGSEREKMSESGVDAVVQKPVDMGALIRIVLEVMHKQ